MKITSVLSILFALSFSSTGVAQELPIKESLRRSPKEPQTVLQETTIGSTFVSSVTPNQVASSQAADLQPIAIPASENPSNSTFDPNAGIRIPPNLGEGRPIERVYIYVSNPTEDAEQNEAVQRQIAETFGLRGGSSFSPLFTDRALSQVRQLPFVQSAEYRLYESNIPGSVIVALIVTLQALETAPPQVDRQPQGLFVSGRFTDFPTLYQSDRALFKFVLNGGAGVFSDTHSWFGVPENFVAGEYQPNGTITWGEYNLEAGLAGISQLGDTNVYLYGSATYTISGTLQPDIFRDDNRFYGAIEQLYGGVLVAERSNLSSMNISVGRQKFQLNQGFLFSQFSGSANALDRAASFLNPRTAYEMTVLADARLGDIRLRGFLLQPDELPIADSETQYIGASLNYNNNRNFEAALSYIAVPQSSRLYPLPGGQLESREGLQVINPRIRLTNLFGVEGLWAESEYAHQFNDRFDMSAHGGYVWLGYTATTARWRPSISYRFAGFSGDDPTTSAYERFDPLQAGGLSDWLQGLSLGKVFNNSNSFSHRVSLSVQPSEVFSLSLDYYYRFADELNNLGGNRALQTLQSRDIGHEVQLIGRYFLSQNFLLQGVSSIAFPGDAIHQAVSEETDPWFTVQISLFMFF